MGQRRLLMPAEMDGLYHVVSRVVDKRMVFGEEEKRKFRELLLAYAGFSGIDVVAWCLMDNHFHLLLRVPNRVDWNPEDLPEEVVVRRLSLIYNDKQLSEVRRTLDLCVDPASRRGVLARYTRRMGDLSLMMKTLKQRFTQWYNGRHGRDGTLWESRFKSVVLEIQGDTTLGHVARVVSAYIDLNPVRAGLVEDPAEYAWCGYARAVAGEEESRRGVLMVWGGGGGVGRALAEYRVFLFEEGSEEKNPDGGIQDVRTGEWKRRGAIDARRVWEERARGGKLPLPVILRLRLRYFVDGGAIGGERFLSGLARNRSKSVVQEGEEASARRRDGVTEGAAGMAAIERPEANGGKAPRAGVPMRFGTWDGLRVLRNLRVNLVG